MLRTISPSKSQHHKCLGLKAGKTPNPSPCLFFLNPLLYYHFLQTFFVCLFLLRSLSLPILDAFRGLCNCLPFGIPQMLPCHAASINARFLFFFLRSRTGDRICISGPFSSSFWLPVGVWLVQHHRLQWAVQRTDQSSSLSPSKYK